jgi:DNA replication protein DnaC
VYAAGEPRPYADNVLAHLATGTFVAKAENVILLGPPGIGKTHLAIGLGVKATQAGYSVLFDTASNWIARLATAHQAGRLEAELKKIRRYKLIIVDEVGCAPRGADGFRGMRGPPPVLAGTG